MARALIGACSRACTPNLDGRVVACGLYGHAMTIPVATVARVASAPRGMVDAVAF